MSDINNNNLSFSHKFKSRLLKAKSLVSLLFTFILLFFLSSMANTKNVYNINQIETLKLSKSGTDFKLTFSPIIETAWYCPGLFIEKNDEQTHISVVRCRINTKCEVTHSIDTTAKSPWTLSIGAIEGEILLKDEKDLHKLNL